MKIQSFRGKVAPAASGGGWRGTVAGNFGGQGIRMVGPENAIFAMVFQWFGNPNVQVPVDASRGTGITG